MSFSILYFSCAFIIMSSRRMRHCVTLQKSRSVEKLVTLIRCRLAHEQEIENAGKSYLTTDYIYFS